LSVRLAATGLGLHVLSYGLVGIGYAVGGDDAISDNWVGALGAFGLFGGLALLGAGFVLAAIARARHEHWPMLWLPLAGLPAALAALLLVELLVLE
jgi:hypothetical protein